MKKLNMKRKLTTAAMAFALCLAGSSITASAQNVDTTEFGKFTYNLTRSGSTVTATTKCTKAAPVLITTVEVQVNSTGKKLGSASATKKNAKENVVIKATNIGDVKLAAFSCHEARGQGSVAYYSKSVF